MSDKLTPDSLKDIEIVIIDDDDDSLDVASIVLEFAGANVTPASDGKEGIDAVRRVSPRLVLCDISMPIMDGWEFIRLMRNDTTYHELTIIALTAHAMVERSGKGSYSRIQWLPYKTIGTTTFVNQLLAVLQKAGVQQSLLSSLTKE